LAHHAPQEQLKEFWKAPRKAFQVLRTTGNEGFVGPNVVEEHEGIPSCADDGNRIYVLFCSKSGYGAKALSPMVPNYRLACFDESGKEEWSRDIREQTLHGLAPFGSGVIICNTGENDEPARALYASATGEIRNLDFDKVILGSNRLDNPQFSMISKAVSEGWQFCPSYDSVGDSAYYDPYTLYAVLLSPAEDRVSIWFHRGSISLDLSCKEQVYGLVPKSRNDFALQRSDGPSKGSVRYVPPNSKSFACIGDSYFGTPDPCRPADAEQFIGVLDEHAVWVHEKGPGLTLCSMDLKTKETRCLDLPMGRVSMELQLTLDGKVFFKNRGKGRYGSEWYFLANARQMNATPEASDLGPQELWCGNPRRFIFHGTLYVLQPDLPTIRDDAPRQRILKQISEGIDRSRAQHEQLSHVPKGN